MYEAFFGFQSTPFPAVPVVANYFPAQGMESARQNLVRAIERAEGPGLVVGPAGIGKSLLLQVLSDYFANTFRVVHLSGNRVTTRKSLLQTILFELEMSYRGLDEGELRLALIDALRRDDSIPNGILLLIDEAQTLSMRLLDETRLITNVAQEGQPRVRLILAGTPRLEERFTNPKLESLNQRIAARCYLQNFSKEETYEYIRAEISWAGGNPDSLLSDDTMRAIFQATDGIPRLINQVCDHALVLAHAKARTHLDPGLIQDAWADMQQLPPPWQPNPAKPSSSQSTVIEFGELDGDDSRTTFESLIDIEFPIDEECPVTDSDPITAQNDSPCDEDSFCEVPSAREQIEIEIEIEEEERPFPEFTSDSVLITPSFGQGSLEWVNCGEVNIEEEAPSHVEPDPFSDAFEEDIVVIDRFAARNLDGLRGRPRVSCAESRDLAASITLLEGLVRASDVPQSESHATCILPESSREQSFEFVTLQDLPAIDLRSEFTDELATLSSGTDERVELDFDEEIDCVPLPWTRSSLGDDRDIIIVEDDSPKLGMAGSSEATAEGGRRTEFRDLFAQLRRVST